MLGPRGPGNLLRYLFKTLVAVLRIETTSDVQLQRRVFDKETSRRTEKERAVKKHLLLIIY